MENTEEPKVRRVFSESDVYRISKVHLKMQLSRAEKQFITTVQALEQAWKFAIMLESEVEPIDPEGF
jgi:hypothetical protein